MSASLLEKSLRLLDSDSTTKKSLNPKKSVPGATGVKKPIKEVKHQFPKKKNNGKRKGKQSIVELVKNKSKEDKTRENLGILDQLSLKKSITQTSADKIFKYQLKKTNKSGKDTPAAKKDTTSVFTEEDFAKFESEYFV